VYPVSPAYLPTIATGGWYTIRCDAKRDGVILPGGKDLALGSGSITDDSRPGVRRQLDVEFAPDAGSTVQDLFDLLAPYGIELHVRSLLWYPNQVSVEVVPMGVFDVDAEAMGYGASGSLKVSASDKWVRIQRAGFVTPFASTPGVTVIEQIKTLIRGALGVDEPVTVTATSTALMGKLVWDENRDKAIIELAESIGAWVYFDRRGVATIADLPTGPSTPVWEITDGDDGVFLDGTRSRDRSKTRNIVVVTPEKVDGTPLFAPVVVQDNDPASPTYVGGAFGPVPDKYSSPLLRNGTQATLAGAARLHRLKGLNAQLRLSIARNHALDSLDTVRVRLPQVRWDKPRPVEIHMLDRIVHPLTADATQSIDTRSTRTDEV
jgi:hypothetical protein